MREWALPRPAWLDKQYWTDLVGEADATAASAASSDAAAAVASSDDALPQAALWRAAQEWQRLSRRSSDASE